MTPKCGWCGKFIRLTDEVRVIFTPDTHLTVEETEYQCVRCQKKAT